MAHAARVGHRIRASARFRQPWRRPVVADPRYPDPGGTGDFRIRVARFCRLALGGTNSTGGVACAARSIEEWSMVFP